MKLSIRPRWYKVRSDLWDNKFRTLLVVFSIAVGVFAVGMIAGAYVIISNDMNVSYASSNPANVEIWTDPFDDELLKSIQHIENVKEAEGRRFVNVRARSTDGTWVSLDLAAQADFQESKINLVVPVEGVSFPGDKEFILEKSTLDDLPVEVGQEVEFQLSDGTTRKMPAVGVVLDQSSRAGDFLAAPLGYITFDTLEWLHQPSNYNRLWVTVSEGANDEAAIRQVADAVKQKLEKSGRQVYRSQFNQSNMHPMTSTVQAILGVLWALGVLIVLLSSSLIANTLGGLLNQHTRFIGVMKLVGARSRQIFGMYLLLILAFGLIALVIAIPLGARAAYGLSELISDQLNFMLLGYRIIPFALICQLIIAVLVPLAAGYLPIYHGSRISVQSAISGVPASTHKKKAGKGGERTVRSVRWISRPLLISLRNTFRRKGRLILTLFTLSMGGAIFIAVFNVRVALNNHIDTLGNYFLADVTASFERPYRLSEIEQVAMQVPGVKAVEGWAFASAEIINPDGTVAENLQVLAPPVESQLVEPVLVSGRWIMPGDGKAIAISESILETYPNLKPGDILNLDVAGHKDDWTVVGIFKFAGINSILSYTGYDTLSTLLGMPGKAFSYRIVTDDHSPANQQAMSTQLDEYFRQAGFKVNEVEPGSNSLKVATEGINVLTSFLLVMALLTAMVGSMGLTGTMGMNVLERTREIGVMRSIGAVDWVVVKTIIIEGMVIGLISWGLGSILSFPFTTFLSSIISLAIFETMIEVAFTPVGFLIWLVLVVILSILASILPARNASRLTIREVLAYE